MTSFPARSRATYQRAMWPRELQRAALLLGISATLLWSSFAIGRWIVAAPGSGPIYLDILIAWTAMIIHIAAWPNLWLGLRDLRGRQPQDGDSIVAWRSFLLTLGLIFAAVGVLPLEYRSIGSSASRLLDVYVTAFPYQGWMFIPVLALHGILFGRVAKYLEARSRHIATAGALVLFAVAAATTAVILQNPGMSAFARSWSVGRGLLPAAALGGYVLIACGIAARSSSAFARTDPWTHRRARWEPRTRW